MIILKPSEEINFLKLRTQKKNKKIKIIPLMLKDDVIFKRVVS